MLWYWGVTDVFARTTIYLNATCNADCSCSRELYNPVCGADQVLYFSPCHAGCTGVGLLRTPKGKVCVLLTEWELCPSSAPLGCCQYVRTFSKFFNRQRLWPVTPAMKCTHKVNSGEKMALLSELFLFVSKLVLFLRLISFNGEYIGSSSFAVLSNHFSQL